MNMSAEKAGSVAENAAERKEIKYAGLSSSFEFIPLAFETMGPINSKGTQFLSDLGRRIAQISGDQRESAFLFQRISILIQRFNAVACHNTFTLPAFDHDL